MTISVKWWCWLTHSKWRRRTTLLSMETAVYGRETVTIERWRVRCSKCLVTDEDTLFTFTPLTPPSNRKGG